MLCGVASHIWEWPISAKFAADPCAIGENPSLRVLLKTRFSEARRVRMPGEDLAPYL